jgi:hypothetical protein
VNGRPAGSKALLLLATVLPVLLLAVLLVVLAHSSGDEARKAFLDGLSDTVPVLAYLIPGALVELRRPGNRVARAMMLAAVGFWSETMLRTYATLALFVRPDLELPAGGEAAAISTACWTVIIAGVFLLIVVFPTGDLPSRRWRLVVAAGLAGFAVGGLSIITAPGRLDKPFEAVSNPLGMTSFLRTAALIAVVALLALVAAAVDLVLRFRRSRGAERAQFKWLALSVAFLVATLPLALALGFEGATGALVSLGLVLLPVSVAIAVTRYRLYEIDRVVSRTLVYASLTVVLGAAYAGLVLAGQALFSSFAGGSNLAIAGSTLVVAALFLPVRGRVQRFVDRRFYRRRYDAQRTLEAFGARLRQQVGLDTLPGELRGVVEETMQPTHVTLWLREGVEGVSR